MPRAALSSVVMVRAIGKITYQKGAMLLRLLSDVIGVEPFRDALQQLLRTHEYSTATHLNLFSCLNDVVNRANISGWCGALNVTHLMEPYFHQTSFPVIYAHADKNGLSLSQEPFNDISTQLPSAWNYKWIIPVRSGHYNSENTEILWMVPQALENSQQCPLKAINRWHVASYTTATYGRVFYDDESLNSLLKKITSEDAPIGVKISLVGDEVALVARQESKGHPYSYDRLLNILVSVFNTPLTDDPSFSLADITLPQFEFFASLIRDTIDAPLINRLFDKAFGKIYRTELWEDSSSWNANVFKYRFLPYAVMYNVGDATAMAQKTFDKIIRNCQLLYSKNGTSWCSGVPNDIHRGTYCGAAKYERDNGANFATLMQLYSEEVQVNPYFYQEYRALLEGMACTELPHALKEIISLFIESPLQPPMIFGWLKTNPSASDALYNFLANKPDEVLRYRGLSSYLDAMTYNWRTNRRLQQFSSLLDILSPRMTEEQEEVFTEYEEKIQKNIEWSAKYLTSIMRWMYDNLVVIGKERWDKRLPGIVKPKRYDVEITPYIPGSGKYGFYRNLTFDGKIKMKFAVTRRTSEVVLNAHRLVIDPDTIILEDAQHRKYDVTALGVTKDYENGILTIPVAGALFPDVEYSLSISYSGFIFDKPHRGILSNYNFYEFNGKQGWIFSTNFEGGPGSRSLMICCDEPSYKAVFNISVKHAADMTALSNMINTGTVVSKGGWAVTTFQETPKMSSYLVAICVGQFASLSTVSETGVLVRAYSWTGMEQYADFSLKIVAGTVDYMSKYFNYSFPLSKLDIMTHPQHANRDGMANWGLIIGDYEKMMVDTDYADVATLSDVAVTLARDVVQQWFGDLVTMDWWSSTFLNEGLAEYWAHIAASHVLPEQKDYFLGYSRFATTATSLWNDCGSNSSAPLISDDGGLFAPTMYLKGSAIMNVLSSAVPADVLQEGLRNFMIKKAYANASPDELWSSLTEACGSNGVKGWDGKNLDVAAFMKSWTTEKSFPILKVSVDSDYRISYRQESCINGSATWYIPIFSANRTNEEFNWFYGKYGTSPSWSLPFPLTRLDNVRGNCFVRMHYDRMLFPFMKRNMHIVEDPVTHGTILSDAWFFVSREDYSWRQFLDVFGSVDWADKPIPWIVGLQFMEKLYRSFRFTDDFQRISKYLILLMEWTYKTLGQSSNPSTKWDKRMLGSSINAWMCRLNHPGCLNTAEAQFTQFLSNCKQSHSGTAHCAGIVPDFRRTMYCYGLRQNPEAAATVYSLYREYASKANHFIRDGENLLFAMSCLNDTEELNEYVHSILDGELPMRMLSYIGDNDRTARVLYDYLRKNIREVLLSDVDFDYFVDAMTTDWSSKEQLNELIFFEITDDYKLLNEKQQTAWETAIKLNSKRQQTRGGTSERRSWEETEGFCMLALVVWFCLQQRNRVPRRSRKRDPACRELLFLPENAAPRPRPLSTAVWSSLYDITRIGLEAS
ncbi:hypothetical protein Y032_0229g2911 [Ancylostoma ceylanicum]|uniref:Peptidase family M1 n=1 Tax=Ancylostoma ceylanicum TaxID=53326 RepID=A0A016SH25_9BILA|nr:hypothetical protein Y032_0229g2911 [Ancylostoma ceylanicum]